VKTTFYGLDLLRFGLALYLMVFHTVYLNPQSEDLPFRDLLDLGSFATSTFFLLSGFILAHVYFGGETAELKGGTRAFFVKRLTNLYPIHWISLALFLAVGVAGANPINRFALESLDGQAGGFVYLGPLATWANVVLTVLMLHTWNPLYEVLNPPSWSLSALLFFYLCFPWLTPRLLALRRKGMALAVVWVVYLIPPVLFAAMQWYGPAAVGFITSNPLVRLPEFAAGILLCGLYRAGQMQWLVATRLRTGATLLFVLLCATFASLLFARHSFAAQYILHNGALMPAEMALIVVCAGCTVPERWSRLAATLGNSALSIFAIHLPIYMVFVKIEKLYGLGMSPLECARQLAACIHASRDVTPGFAAYPLYMLVCVVAAILFQERVVVPLRNALRGRLLRGAPPRGARAADLGKPEQAPGR
jgi:peptidoglycan/LPS O-acetylase OafA/YrhL